VQELKVGGIIMVSCRLSISVIEGLHLRPISILCNQAIGFESSIMIKKKNKTVNAKSILGVLSAGIKYHDKIELICDGPDEKVAMDVLSELINNGLGVNQ
jgi:phosphocarrier protein HPr